MNKLNEIDEILNFLDDEDLELVHSFVKRLAFDYELPQETNSSYKKVDTNEINIEIDNKEKQTAAKTVQNSNASTSSDAEFYELYENSDDEELLQRMMMWRND